MFPRILLVGLLLAAVPVQGVCQGLLVELTGPSPGDRFGHALDSIGDVTGDGVPDFVVSAPYADVNGLDSGSVHVFSGADFQLLWSAHGDGVQDLFGGSVAGAGDVDGDGVPDVVVGATSDSHTSTPYGGAYCKVLSGVDGSQLLYLLVPQNGYDRFGFSVDGIGDVTGDGRSELLIGAPDYTSLCWLFCSGAAFLISADGSLIATHTAFTSTTHGYDVAGLGDIDGDNVPDYVVGDPDYFGDPVDARARVFSGRNSLEIQSYSGQPPEDRMGRVVANALDVDGDEVNDLIVVEAGSGRTHAFSGETGAPLFELPTAYRAAAGVGDANGDARGDVLFGGLNRIVLVSGADQSVLFAIDGAPGDDLGVSVAAAGDVNQDGSPDLLVGASQSAAGGLGYVRIYSGFQDCDGNGVPDSQQGGPDCNDNGIPDSCDLASGRSEDCDDNGVPDECDEDCNLNGVSDLCDIFSGQSRDCQMDGVPDECQIAQGQVEDCDQNGVPDECDEDCNANGVPDVCDFGFRGYLADSGALGPFGFGSPQAYLIHTPPRAYSDVTIHITAQAWFHTTGSGIVVDVNGTNFGNRFPSGGIDCPLPVRVADVVIPAEQWNALTDNGPARITLSATIPVQVPDACGQETWVDVEVSYLRVDLSSDCNGNAVLDECDVLQGTSADADGNGVPDECQCGALAVCVTSANSVGAGAELDFTGIPSVSASTFVLMADGLPGLTSGLFFYGDQATQTPFGNGIRCVGGNQIRLESQQSNAAGQMQTALDFQSFPFNTPEGSVAAGDTRWFQLWYRDPAGGPPGFNLSNALRVTFCP